jgi:hypothetical protein
MAKASWQESARSEAAQASAIEIDMALIAHCELMELWRDWCGWRTDLAVREKLKPWTPRAARIEMRNIAVALQSFTADQIATQMRAAIVGCWVGLNLDKMRVGPGQAVDFGRQGAW